MGQGLDQCQEKLADPRVPSEECGGMVGEKDSSYKHECQGKEHDNPIVGLAPQQHAADCEPHTGRGDEKQAAHQIEPASQEVCDGDRERKDKRGDPSDPSEEEPAFTLPEVSRVALALWIWKRSWDRYVLYIHGQLLQNGRRMTCSNAPYNDAVSVTKNPLLACSPYCLVAFRIKKKMNRLRRNATKS